MNFLHERIHEKISHFLQKLKKLNNSNRNCFFRSQIVRSTECEPTCGFINNYNLKKKKKNSPKAGCINRSRYQSMETYIGLYTEINGEPKTWSNQWEQDTKTRQNNMRITKQEVQDWMTPKTSLHHWEQPFLSQIFWNLLLALMYVFIVVKIKQFVLDIFNGQFFCLIYLKFALEHFF